MNILSIDSSKSLYEISLLVNNKIVNLNAGRNNSHAENLISDIEAILAENSVDYEDIDAIAVNVGPGSFTALRSGIAASIGFNIAKKISLIENTSFESVAYQALKKHDFKNDDTNILAVINARRNQIYVQILNSNLEIIKDADVIFYDDIVSYCNGFDIDFIAVDDLNLIADKTKYIRCDETIIEDNIFSNSESILNIAIKKYKLGVFQNELSPLYIRKPDAKKKSILVNSK